MYKVKVKLKGIVYDWIFFSNEEMDSHLDYFGSRFFKVLSIEEVQE